MPLGRWLIKVLMPVKVGIGQVQSLDASLPVLVPQITAIQNVPRALKGTGVCR